MSFHPGFYPSLFANLEARVPLLDGSSRAYINLDNAASTPPFKVVQEAVDNFLIYYSSVHRGTGFKSQLCTHAFEQARAIVLAFAGADPGTHSCIFGKNTTEVINKLARRFPFSSKRNVVITSGMEHHSNDLPWRAVAHTVHVALLPDGRFDEADFDAQLQKYAGQVALVAITGASNVTGYINPIHRLAEKAHRAGALILVDCAQLAPHRQVSMLALDDPQHLDFVAISGHKMYAPYGAGALVGRRDIFEQGEPYERGGGTVAIVTLEDVIWADPPEKDEAGSPNTVGAIAMAAAIRQLEQVGMDAIAKHEAALTGHALERLRLVPQIAIVGSKKSAESLTRLGVIPFRLKKNSHFLVAAVLAYEFGIGVRSGCFCAHPYILKLLKLTDAQARRVRDRMLAGDRSRMPGLVRASFGLYNTFDEVDALADALTHISRHEYAGRYVQEKASGEYYPLGWEPDFERYFALA